MIESKKYLIALGISLIMLSSGLYSGDKLSFDIETGPVTASYNTVQVPSPQGTRFSLTDDFDLNSKIYFRLRLSYNLGDRHQLSALYAPLTVTAEGTPSADIYFQNSVFEAGIPVKGSYTFNSYRLTYRYKLVRKPRLDLWIGFTAKIRDAEIRLVSGTRSDNTTNVGFVPLLNLLLDWKWSRGTGLTLEADALAAPGGQGRAEDVALALYYNISDSSRIRAGYRFVEGGANVETVYNFAFLHYFFIGYQLKF